MFSNAWNEGNPEKLSEFQDDLNFQVAGWGKLAVRRAPLGRVGTTGSLGDVLGK